MYNDELNRYDIENAILKGKISKKLSQDIRGTRYKIEGSAKGSRLIHVVCRYKEDGSLIIITVYAIEEDL